MDINNSRTGKTLVNTAANLLARFVYIFFAFAMRSVFIYTLGEQYTGVSSVFTSILNALSFSELGISSAISASLYRPLRERDYAYIRRLMLFYKRAYHSIAVFITAAGAALLPFLDRLIKDVPDVRESIHVIFLFYIVKTASSYVLAYKETLLVADQRQYEVKRIELACYFIRYSAEMACLLVWKQYIVFLVIELAATILQNYAVARKVSRVYPEVFKDPSSASLSKEERGRMFRDIKALSMYKIASKINSNVDNVLISGAISTVTVAYFTNYTLIALMIEEIILQISWAVTPSVGSLAAEGDRQKQSEVFRRLFYLEFLAGNFCAVSFLVLITPFVTWWLDESFVLSEWIAFLLAFDLFLNLLPQAATVFRTGNRLFVRGQYQPLVMTALNILLTLLLIPSLGVFGAVLATIISRTLTNWFEPYLLFKNVLREPFSGYYVLYLAYILLFLSGAGLTWFLAGLLQAKSMLLTLFLRAVCCVIVPNLWAVAFTCRAEGFRYVVGMVKAVLSRIRGGRGQE